MWTVFLRFSLVIERGARRSVGGGWGRATCPERVIIGGHARADYLQPFHTVGKSQTNATNVNMMAIWGDNTPRVIIAGHAWPNQSFHGGTVEKRQKIEDTFENTHWRKYHLGHCKKTYFFSIISSIAKVVFLQKYFRYLCGGISTFALPSALPLAR